ncbi:unnamed protein product [Prunus armeniaca]
MTVNLVHVLLGTQGQGFGVWEKCLSGAEETPKNYKYNIGMVNKLANAPRVRGHLNRVVRGKAARIEVVSPRPARIAARIEVVSPRPARIAARMDLVSPRPARNATRLTLCFQGLRGWN